MISRLLVGAALAALSLSRSEAAMEVELTPSAASSLPTRVWIAPAEVRFDPRFIQDMRNTRGSLGDMREADRVRFAEELGARLHEALSRALRDRGFDIVAAPSPDALSLSPALTHVYLNTPPDPLTSRVYARSAGAARMVIEGRNASGTAVLRASSAGEAGETAAFHEFSGADTRLAFAQLFQDWAGDLATALPKRR